MIPALWKCWKISQCDIQWASWVMRNCRQNKRCWFQYLCPQLTKKSSTVAKAAPKQNIQLCGIQRKLNVNLQTSLQTIPQNMPRGNSSNHANQLSCAHPELHPGPQPLTSLLNLFFKNIFLCFYIFHSLVLRYICWCTLLTTLVQKF